MNRRNALQRVAILMGGAISAPSIAAMLEGCSPSASSGAPFVLSADLQAVVAELAEVIIPKTDTPGAKEVGVGPFIELMLKDCYSSVQQAHFVKGLEDLEAESKKVGGSFVSLTAEQKNSVTAIMAKKAKEEAATNEEKAKQIDTESGLVKDEAKKKDEVEVPVPFFRLMKELTLFGYFTSEKGATEALDFVPVPGRYDGCIKIQPGQKAYAI
ncbi:MAG: gluconate 2-dehydrogenase subunit 3 family protein [Spirosomataceae bacterium]